MGLFSKKDKEKADKNRPDLLNTETTAPPPPSSTPNPTQQQFHNNSYHDSAYHSTTGSNVTEDPGIKRQQQQALQNQPPGTTITTTTTTTTTVTTVTSDGRTSTQVYPYNPSTDPPIRSQETSSVGDTSRTSTIGGSSNTNTLSNPNSATNIPQAQNNTQTQTTQLQPGPQRPEVQRTVSPGRKPTPQELQANSHFNVIPPTPQGSQSSKDPQSTTTTGGRIIPPRSDRRTSPRGSFGNGERPSSFLPDGPLSPGPPMRSEKRNSMERNLNVAPLKTSHSPSNSQGTPVSAGGPGFGNDRPRSSFEAPPTVPPKDEYNNGRDQRDSGYSQNQIYPEYEQQNYTHHNTYVPVGGNSYDPLASGYPGSDNRSHTPSNQSRPGPTVTSASQNFDAPPTSASAMHPPEQTPTEKHSHRKSFQNTFKGIQGASEVIRGTINSGIAKGTHDKAEEERMRAIREKGLQDYRASGLGERMWGGRVAERSDGSRRLRKRSLSRNGIHGSEGAGGLEVVEERSIGSQ